MKGDEPEMFHDTIVSGFKDVEAQLREELGDDTIDVPVDVEGADILYVGLAGSHTIKPVARIFHEVNQSWTLSLFEAANYGYFLGDGEKAKKIAKRFMDEAVRLNVKEVVITECGHAYRVAKIFYEAWAGETMPFKVSHILEVIDRYMAEGRLKLKPDAITETITYHDPCQIGRNGGLYEEPRRIVEAISTDFRDLTPNRAEQWCCGGGGGLVALTDMEDMRLASGIKKVEQIRATGATVIASPCENCRLQMEDLVKLHDMDLKVMAVMELVVEAME